MWCDILVNLICMQMYVVRCQLSCQDVVLPPPDGSWRNSSPHSFVMPLIPNFINSQNFSNKHNGNEFISTSLIKVETKFCETEFSEKAPSTPISAYSVVCLTKIFITNFQWRSAIKHSNLRSKEGTSLHINTVKVTLISLTRLFSIVPFQHSPSLLASSARCLAAPSLTPTFLEQKCGTNLLLRLIEHLIQDFHAVIAIEVSSGLFNFGLLSLKRSSLFSNHLKWYDRALHTGHYD